jgi:hypothetical protein
MRDARFRRPGTEFPDIPAFTNCNGPILVPYNLPIRFRSLVKQYPADSKARRPKYGAHELLHRLRESQIAHGWSVQQISLRVLAALKGYAERSNGLLIETA